MSTNASNFLVIMLHGVGSNGNDLAPLTNVWKADLPDTVFISPNAPSKSSLGSGYQWFSVAGVTEENRSWRIAEARVAFDKTISAIVDESGFSDKLDYVAFVGFSQGTIMALDAVASGRWPIGAAVGFSGRLALPEPLTPSVQTPILLIHGDADAVISSIETTKAATVLQALGMDVETLIVPGLPHTISAEGAAAAGKFLAATLTK